MPKNFEVKIPKDAETEVVNKKALRSNVFTRTRIAALSFLLVLALGAVGATHAYVQWTANQTPNRDVPGSVEIEIVETNIDKDGNSTELDTETSDTTNGTAAGGNGNKVVAVKSDNDPNRVEEVARVQFVPEFESNDVTDAHIAISEYWGKGVQQDATTGKYYLETDVLLLWLDDNWSTSWSYNDNGAFYYKKVLQKNTKTPTLLTGATLKDDVNKSDYKSIKVKVVAEALEVTPKEALDAWGVKITGEKTDAADNRAVELKTEDDEEETTP